MKDLSRPLGLVLAILIFFFPSLSQANNSFNGAINGLTSMGTKEKVDINTAPLDDLQKIVGVGSTMAKRIIEARPFYSLDELIKVKGIGPKTLEKIKKQGLAWVDPELAPSKIAFQVPRTSLLTTNGFFEEIWKFLSTFLIALALAIFSGMIILILKRKLNRDHLKT